MPRKVWVPLSKREDPKRFIDALHEGVPGWLAPSLLPWVEWALSLDDSSFDVDTLREMERRIRRPLGAHWMAIERDLRTDGELFLDVLNYLLGERTWHPDALKAIDRSLEEAGSAWKVVLTSRKRGTATLQRRVHAAAVRQFNAVRTASGRAGELLASAWSHQYGRNQSPKHAFADAVSAVEAAAVPVVCPDDAKATLSSIIRELEKHPDKFVLVMRPKDSVKAQDVLISMCRLLWKAQADRHGTPDLRSHTNISADESEAAVHLAVTLVHWFTSGSVTRAPGSKVASAQNNAKQSEVTRKEDNA